MVDQPLPPWPGRLLKHSTLKESTQKTRITLGFYSVVFSKSALKMKLIREIDYLLLAATIATVGLGIIAIYSAAYHSDSQVVQMAWIKQARFAFIALLGSLVVMHMPNKLLYGLSYPFYGFALLSLIAVLLWGTGEDAARWLHVGPLRLQPSEFAKIASIIALLDI